MALGSTSRCRRYTFLASRIVTQGFNVYQKAPESVTDIHNDRWPSISFRIHNRRCYKNASSCSVCYTVHTLHNGSPWTFHLAGLLDSISFHGTKVCNTHLEVDMLVMDVSTIFMCIAFCFSLWHIITAETFASGYYLAWLTNSYCHSLRCSHCLRGWQCVMRFPSLSLPHLPLSVCRWRFICCFSSTVNSS